MAKWIELNTGELVNIDITCNISKHDKWLECESRRYRYDIVYKYNSDAELECFYDEVERDKRFEEIKAMLLDKAPETDTQPVKAITATDIMIEEMELSYRAFNCLKRAGINTLDDVISLGSDGLLKIRNLGKKSYDEIVRVLVNRYHQPQRNWRVMGNETQCI